MIYGSAPETCLYAELMTVVWVHSVPYRAGDTRTARVWICQTY